MNHSFFFFSSLQTIKCLLIYPNPESALNEEAGKLLLEQYDDYFTRAKMMTEIHAIPPRGSKDVRDFDDMCPSTSSSSSSSSGPQAKKHAGDKKLDKKKKDKKRTLKRLWKEPPSPWWVVSFPSCEWDLGIQCTDINIAMLSLLLWYKCFIRNHQAGWWSKGNCNWKQKCCLYCALKNNDGEYSPHYRRKVGG